MSRMALVFALALTGAGCAHVPSATAQQEEAPLWKAAFALSRGPSAQREEATLREAGPAGYDVVSRLARGSGDAAALQAASAGLRCRGVLFNGPPRGGLREETPSSLAARFAGKLLTESPELRERALASDAPFDRALALMASAKDAKALLALLAKLEGEKNLLVLSTAENALQCARALQGNVPEVAEPLLEARHRFSQRLTVAKSERGCESPDGVTDNLVEQLASGAWRVSGWSSSNGEAPRVSLDTGDGGRMHLAPECSLALYDALARRDVFKPGLVLPLSTESSTPANLRGEASRRAVRDLAHYPEQERNRLTAQLVNAGYTAPVPVTSKTDDTFGQEVELEAAVRQGQKGALEAVNRLVLCRGTFGNSGIDLLGYVGTQQAADTAYELARSCPHALAPATAALVRLEDPRGLELLGRALAEPGFSRKALERAALEHRTPELLHKLESLEGHEAKALLEHLQAEPAPGH